MKQANTPANNPCPCGSEKPFGVCCQPLVSQQTIAATPEQLMRSRYSAYALGYDDYIMANMCGKALRHAKRTQHAKSASGTTHGQTPTASVEWIALDVLDAPLAKGREGFVEFKAHYRSLGQHGILHERSRFLKKEGRWYYVDGITPDHQ